MSPYECLVYSSRAFFNNVELTATVKVPPERRADASRRADILNGTRRSHRPMRRNRIGGSHAIKNDEDGNSRRTASGEHCHPWPTHPSYLIPPPSPAAASAVRSRRAKLFWFANLAYCPTRRRPQQLDHRRAVGQLDVRVDTYSLSSAAPERILMRSGGIESISFRPLSQSTST